MHADACIKATSQENTSTLTAANNVQRTAGNSMGAMVHAMVGYMFGEQRSHAGHACSPTRAVCTTPGTQMYTEAP